MNSDILPGTALKLAANESIPNALTTPIDTYKIPQIFDDPFLLITRECTMSNLRIGNGYDIHKLVAGRPLILGGVEIPHSHGLFGNTDADVLVHAIIDAILGALSLGDIGHHFPPDDPSVKDARSLDMLRQVMKMINERSWRINNVDSIVIAERPKLQHVREHRRRYGRGQ